MAPRNLSEFLDILRREGELCEVDVPVNPYLEIPEIHRRVIAAGGPALLFTRPNGAKYPLVTNLFGTRRRVELAFGPDPERVVAQAARLAQELPTGGLGSLWEHRALAGRMLRVGLARRRRGAVTEVVDCEPDLSDIPMTTSWPEDGGPFLTLPLVYTQSPLDGTHNLGIYRMQRFDSRTMGMHWQIGKGGGFHHAEAESAGSPLPVVVHLGGPPALMLSAVAPLPEGIGELILASLVAGRRINLTRSPGNPLPVIADAEFAIIGQVPAGPRRAEGPFGDHYGYYSLQHDYPILEVQSVCHRRNAVVPATVVGKPRQEDFFLGDYIQELLQPLFPLVMPAVRDLWSYGETGYHSLSAAVVEERYRREAMASAFRILGEGQLSLTKFLLVTDAPLDLRDFTGLLEHILARVRWETDLFVFANLSMDTLDYTGPRVNEGSKGIILGLGDAVRELPGEFRGALPPGITEAHVFCRGCLVVGGASAADDADLGRRIAAHPDFAPWPLVVLVDQAKEASASEINFLWTTFTRFDPASDIYAARERVAANHVVRTGPIVIDSRLRPGFPGELFADEETAHTVTDRWGNYFPGGMAMGSSDHAHLTTSNGTAP